MSILVECICDVCGVKLLGSELSLPVGCTVMLLVEPDNTTTEAKWGIKKRFYVCDSCKKAELKLSLTAAEAAEKE